jgi:hypothetical protein
MYTKLLPLLLLLPQWGMCLHVMVDTCSSHMAPSLLLLPLLVLVLVAPLVLLPCGCRRYPS